MSTNGNGAAPVQPQADTSAATVVLVPVSGAEAVTLYAASVALENVEPLANALGVTLGYAPIVRGVYERWLAEVGRPAREREASV